MKDEKKKSHDDDRMESYPRPSKKDISLDNQPEFIEEQPNDFHDTSLPVQPAKESDIPEAKEWISSL